MPVVVMRNHTHTFKGYKTELPLHPHFISELWLFALWKARHHHMCALDRWHH